MTKTTQPASFSAYMLGAPATAPMAPETETDPGWGDYLGAGIDSMQAQFQRTGALTAESMGFAGAADRWRLAAKANEDEAARVAYESQYGDSGWQQLANLKDAEWWQSTIGQAIPTSAPFLAGAAAGGAGGFAVGGPIGALVGAILGGGSAAFSQELGSAHDEYLEANPGDEEGAVDYAFAKAGLTGAINGASVAVAPLRLAATPFKQTVFQSMVQSGIGTGDAVAGNAMVREHVNPNQQLSEGAAAAFVGEAAFEAPATAMAARHWRKSADQLLSEARRLREQGNEQEAELRENLARKKRMAEMGEPDAAERVDAARAEVEAAGGDELDQELAAADAMAESLEAGKRAGERNRSAGRYDSALAEVDALLADVELNDIPVLTEVAGQAEIPTLQEGDGPNPLAIPTLTDRVPGTGPQGPIPTLRDVAPEPGAKERLEERQSNQRSKILEIDNAAREEHERRKTEKEQINRAEMPDAYDPDSLEDEQAQADALMEQQRWGLEDDAAFDRAEQSYEQRMDDMYDVDMPNPDKPAPVDVDGDKVDPETGEVLTAPKPKTPTENLKEKLQSFKNKDLTTMLRDAGMLQAGTREEKIQRIADVREGFEAIKGYKNKDEIAEAVERGEIDKEDLARWANAARHGQQVAEPSVRVTGNINRLVAWANRNGGLKEKIADRNPENQAAYDAKAARAEENARLREAEFDNRAEFVQAQLDKHRDEVDQFWANADADTRRDFLQQIGAANPVAKRSPEQQIEMLVKKDAIKDMPGRVRTNAVEWVADNWENYRDGRNRAQGVGAQDDLALAASEAATSPENDLPEPTEGQKAAGNYKKGHVKVAGLDVAIENPKGSKRTGTDPDGKEWSNTMAHHYGYIKRTEGADGDAVDVFVNAESDAFYPDTVYVIDQVDQNGEFDEHKAMVGFKSEAEAVEAYKAHYDKDWKVGPVTRMATDEFKAWAQSGDTKTPLKPDAVEETAEWRETDVFGEKHQQKVRIPVSRLEGARGGADYDVQPVSQRKVDGIRQKIKSGETFDGPIVRETKRGVFEVVDGHHRLAAMKQEGAKTVDAWVIRDAAPKAEQKDPAAYNSEAPEHTHVGASARELDQVVKEFGKAADIAQLEDGTQMHHLFDSPKKDEVVRLNDKAKVYHKEHGWMTPAEAKAKIAEWKKHARGQDKSKNADKIVLSLFDLTGKWSQPWEEAGYQVYRFDIQEGSINELLGREINVGDIHNMGHEYFADLFGHFDGNDVHAILAACPCTDFASSGARHFAAKDKDGRTVASVELVHQTLAAIEYFKPAVWAIENPVGRIEKLGGLPPWRLSFDPNHVGEDYTKKTLIWGRFNADLPIAPTEATEGSKMHSKYGGKSLATKNARSATPEGFAYSFFMANNAIDHPVMTIANKYDRLDRDLIQQAVAAGLSEQEIDYVVQDPYYQDLDDAAAEQALRDATAALSQPEKRDSEQRSIYSERIDDMGEAELRDYVQQLRTELLTDERTGLGSNKAWLNREPKTYVASIDLDSLKFVNDTMGHGAGDQMIALVGDALRHAGIAEDSYHVSGDEFYAEANNAIALRKALRKAQDWLAQQTVDGDGGSLKGPSFSFGIDKDLKNAETKLQADKQAREKAGQRAARGERPAGYVSAADRDGTGRKTGSSAKAAADRPKKSAGRKRKAAKVTKKQAAAQEWLGAKKGDTVVFSEDVGYARAGADYTVENIGSDGSIEVSSPRGRTVISAGERLGAARKGVTVEAQAKTDPTGQQLLDAAAKAEGTYKGKSLKPLAQEIAEHAVQHRRRMTKAEQNKLAKKHDVPADVLDSLLQQPFSIERVLFDAQRGVKASQEWLDAKPETAYRRGAESGNAAEIRETIDLFAKTANIDVEVVSKDGLPDGVKADMRRRGIDSTKGVYHNGKVYIVAEAHKDANDALATYLHEVVGHAGVRAVLGAQFDPVVRQIFKNQRLQSQLQKIADQYGLDMNNEADHAEIADEFLASIAEKGVHQNLWNRVVAMVRRALRKLGLAESWTDNDIKDLLVRGYEAMHGKPAKTGARSEAFKRWFGKSKITDWKGDPRVVYHGTKADFDTFDDSAQRGLYFSGSPSLPNAVLRVAANEGQDVTGSNIMPVYLRIENPLVLNSLNPVERARLLGRKFKNRNSNDSFFKHAQTSSIWPEQIAELKALGYDGIVDESSTWSSIIAFDANQVKSATGNRGTYDRNSSDIRYRQEEETNDATGRSSGVLSGGRQDPYADLYEEALSVEQKSIGRGDPSSAAFSRLADGEEVLLFHRSEQPFERFDNERVGSNTETDSAALGHWLSVSDDLDPGRYGSHVSQWSVRLDKPYRLTVEQFDALGQKSPAVVNAVKADLERRGFDGIIIEELEWAAVFDADSIRKPRTPRYRLDSDAQAAIESDPTGEAAIRYRLDAVAEAVQNANGAAALKDVASDLGSKNIPKFLGLIPRRYLSDFAKNLPSVNAYIRSAQSMDARRGHLHNEAAEKVDRVVDYVRKNKDEAGKLFDLEHEATLAGYDPAVEEYVPLTYKMPGVGGEEISLTDKDVVAKAIRQLQARARRLKASEGTNAAIKDLKNRWAQEQSRREAAPGLRKKFRALSSEAQALYREMRDAYRDHHEAIQKALDERLQALQEANEREAELAAAEGRPANKSGGEVIAQLRKNLESQKVAEPYFPLARFGEYWASAKDADGQVVAFSRFESRSEQQQWRKQMEAEGNKTDGGRKMDSSDVVGQIDPTFASKVTKMVTDVGGDKAKTLADEIWQMYLDSLPDLSMRKHAMHRKKRAGFAKDALRGYAHSLFHGAHQLARLEYTHELEAHLHELKEEARSAEVHENDDWAAPMYNEMLQRHDWAMNPQVSEWATQATQLGFLWYLGVTPAAALVNMTQTFMVGLPILGARFGWGKAASALAKNGMTLPGQMEKKLKGDRLAAYKRLLDLGVIDKTQAHDLAGISEHGGEYTGMRHQVMEKISFFFHKAELWNREVTAMAAYDLAREKGLDHEAAIQAAADGTWDSHFDYSNANRPRFMQNNFAKVILLFKQHSLNMTYRLARDFHDSFRGESKEVRKQARAQLTGILMMTGLFAGTAGMPMLWAIEGILNTVLGDEDEPFDAMTEFRAYLAQQYGKDTADLIIKGAADKLTGLSISGRVGLNSLWIRDPMQDLEGRQYWQHLTGELLGPVFKIGESAMEGAVRISEGQTARGIEGMVPKFAKDTLKGLRYMSEGATNMRGDSIKEQFASGEILGQILGFTPADLSLQYEQNNAVKKYERRILERRSLLLNRYWLAQRFRDGDLLREVRGEIRDYNKANRRYALTPDTIRRSMRRRLAVTRESIHGVTVNPNLRYLTKELNFSE